MKTLSSQNSLPHKKSLTENSSTVSAPERPSKNRFSTPRKSRGWRVTLGAVLTFILCWAIFTLWSEFSELGPTAVLGSLNPFASQGVLPSFHLQEQPVYKIKKKQKLLGMQVYRIISRQLPQEFLLLSGVSTPLLDKVFDKPIDRFWANQTAQQLLSLRSTGSSDEISSGGKEPTIEVQSVIPEQVAPLMIDGHLCPYWQLKIRFQLSTENIPRYYQVGILRPLAAYQTLENHKESIIIAYAPQSTYQKALIANVLDVLQPD